MRLKLVIALVFLLTIYSDVLAAGCVNGSAGVDDNINCTTGDNINDTPHGIDANSGNNTVTVNGSAILTGTTGDGIYAENGNDSITVSDTASITGAEDGIQVSDGINTVTIGGSAFVGGAAAGINSNGVGANTITITGNATLNGNFAALKFDGTTTDTITISGTATINGGDITLDGGDDTVTVSDNPVINPTINGGAGNDTLVFNLTVPPADLAALQAELATKNPANDSMFFNGNEIVWEGFETLTDNLVDGTVPAPGSGGTGGNNASSVITDNRINRTVRDVAAPVAVYQSADTLDVYAIDPTTSNGTLLIRLSLSEIVAQTAGDAPLMLASGTIPATGRAVTVYLLPGGEVQLNSTYYDLTAWKPYVIIWSPSNPAGLYHGG